MARVQRDCTDTSAYLGIATDYRGRARIKCGMAVVVVVVVVVGVVNLLWTRLH